MANKKISELTLFATANSTDEIPINRLGMNGKLTVSSILAGSGVPTSRTISTTSPLSGGGDLTANRTLSIPQASSSVNGYLSSANWTTFNGKQDVISHLEYNNTDLTLWNNGKGNISTNTSFGGSALKSNTTGSNNVALGDGAMNNNTQGYYNVAIGSGALYTSTISNNNVAIGKGANYYGAFGESVSIGNEASFYSVGNSSVAIGYHSLRGTAINTTIGNIGIGYSSLKNVSTNADYNVAIGYNSLLNNTSGATNIAIGYGTNSGNFNSSIILGINAAATASNQFVVGSVPYPTGAVTTEVNSSTQVWNVIINGVARKILLA